MTGIFYDPRRRCLRRVEGQPPPGWTLVTHDLGASANHCRRKMSEWLSREELAAIDWTPARPGTMA
jgi:hypothetical protein